VEDLDDSMQNPAHLAILAIFVLIEDAIFLVLIEVVVMEVPIEVM
jgi:hypothetical protein